MVLDGILTVFDGILTVFDDICMKRRELNLNGTFHMWTLNYLHKEAEPDPMQQQIRLKGILA